MQGTKRCGELDRKTTISVYLHVVSLRLNNVHAEFFLRVSFMPQCRYMVCRLVNYSTQPKQPNPWPIPGLQDRGVTCRSRLAQSAQYTLYFARAMMFMAAISR